MPARLALRISLFAAWLAAGTALTGCSSVKTKVANQDAPEALAPTGLSCPELASIELQDTSITAAEVVPAGAFAPAPSPIARPADYSSMPEFCRVTGSIHPTARSDIRFEAWLPTHENWNGRFMQVGNGGAAGALVHSSMVEPLTRGYAVVHTDTGHKGSPGDFSWAKDEPEKLVDYQYRSVPELTLKGKKLTEFYFGAPPDRSYWYGCSTGGRQGLQQAQRYPDHYDAILAGAPANDWPSLMVLSIHVRNNLGPDALPVSKLDTLQKAAIAACDADDGIEDGVISHPGRCDFDVASLQCQPGEESHACLTPKEIAAAKRIYAGLVTRDGVVAFPGKGFGSEKAWAIYASPFFSIGTSYMQNLIANDLNWDPKSLDIDADLARIEAFDQGASSAVDPDLSEFVEHGGKLLLYHGTADGLIPFENTVNYFQSVVSTLGAETVADSIQLFLVPGMGHCDGGYGASEVDWLTALENWDATGEKPRTLLAKSALREDQGTRFSRPVCEYPRFPVHDGNGAGNSAESFSCRNE